MADAIVGGELSKKIKKICKKVILATLKFYLWVRSDLRKGTLRGYLIKNNWTHFEFGPYHYYSIERLYGTYFETYQGCQLFWFFVK